MGEPLITVVVPVYNAENYLDECVKSILAQSYTSWELILVNDGSTDGSPALCDGWQSRDERIRAIHKANGGVSSARNAGMDAAKGEYLAFVDADDWVEPEYLQVLYQTLGQTDLAICCVFDESDWNEKVKEEIVSLQRLRTTPSQYANPIYINYPCNKLFAAELIRRNQLKFPTKIHRCEDAYFVQDYLLCCREISISKRKLYHYIQRDGSAMHSFYEGVCDDEIPLMQRQCDFFHPQLLSEREERAYCLWEWGKILAVLRYIASYAPERTTKRRIFQMFLKEPHVKHCIRNLRGKAGKKMQVVAWLLRIQQFDLFEFLVTR